MWYFHIDTLTYSLFITFLNLCIVVPLKNSHKKRNESKHNSSQKFTYDLCFKLISVYSDSHFIEEFDESPLLFCLLAII